MLGQHCHHARQKVPCVDPRHRGCSYCICCTRDAGVVCVCSKDRDGEMAGVARKVCKFGGSSLAQQSNVLRVNDILQTDPLRSHVVVSAPGKRFHNDEKITDALLELHNQASEGTSTRKTFEDAFEPRSFLALTAITCTPPRRPVSRVTFSRHVCVYSGSLCVSTVGRLCGQEWEGGYSLADIGCHCLLLPVVE